MERYSVFCHCAGCDVHFADAVTLDKPAIDMVCPACRKPSALLGSALKQVKGDHWEPMLDAIYGAPRETPGVVSPPGLLPAGGALFVREGGDDPPGDAR